MRPLLWEHLACADAQASALAASLQIDPVVARLLCLRGLGDPDAATRFLNPSLDHLLDPFQLADMPTAVDRLLGAVERRERIAVHGDYDVDGVIATVILRRALELLGGDVVHFIPHRILDGYGLLPEAVDRLHAQQDVRVIVSVDCGIRSDAAARRARDLGVDLIITDHHEPDLTLPDALAVINPKRHDCTYPDKDLSGAGVALKLVQALCARTGRQGWLPAFIKMAAVGTLADVVPLRGENRVIAKLGLERLSQGPHTVGLRALLEASGLTGKPIDSFHVGFVLAPRINAAGRMSTPDLATRLLLAVDEGMADEARLLAEQLNAENTERQREEAEILVQARRAVETDPDVGAHGLLVVSGDGWHRGVIGIVASKLVDAFHRPAIVLAIEEDVAYGSGRSIPGFDLLAALERCRDLFTRFGGHRQAAGLTLEASRLKEFRTRITEDADARLGPDELTPRLRIDGALPLPAITAGVIAGVATLAPFGVGNRRPIFHADGVAIVDGPRTVKERHLKMSVRQGQRVFRAIAWQAAERADFLNAHRAALNLAFSLTENHYRGQTFVELSVADVQAGFKGSSQHVLAGVRVAVR